MVFVDFDNFSMNEVIFDLLGLAHHVVIVHHEPVCLITIGLLGEADIVLLAEQCVTFVPDSLSLESFDAFHHFHLF